MKKKLISTLMVSIFLFVVGINGVRADDPAGESVAPTGQSLPAGEADDSTPPSENVNQTGQAIEAPPVEDNSGVAGENSSTTPTAEEAPPVQLIDVTIGNKKYSLGGIVGTIKETKYAYDCNEKIYIFVLTNSSVLYTSGAINPNSNDEYTIMHEVANESSSKIVGLVNYDVDDYVKKIGSTSYCMANLGVKFENGKIYSLQYNNKNYYLDTKNECILEESATTLTNKESNIKAILSSDEKNFNSNSTISAKIYNNNEEQYKKFETAVKKLIGKYSKIKLFDIYLTNSNNESIQPSSTVKVIIPIPEGYDKNRIAIYHLKDNGDLEKIKSTIEDKNIVFETNHFSLYGIVENNKQGLITNPKTGNYITYTFGLLFIVISGIGIFALKNRKLFNK